jgi:hypothetical protein
MSNDRPKMATVRAGTETDRGLMYLHMWREMKLVSEHLQTWLLCEMLSPISLT